jgi:hypothetical protein
MRVNFTEPSFDTIREKLNHPEKYDQFFDLKHEALALWAQKVRPDTGKKAWLADNVFGSGDWDHKPRIGPVWGVWNRIGNSPSVYYYDIWSNIHFGFVGRVAGFSLEELVWGSNAAQEADSGTKDPKRDAESVQAGAALFGRLDRGIGKPHRPIFPHDLLTTLSYHEPKATANGLNGWGKHMPYSSS